MKDNKYANCILSLSNQLRREFDDTGSRTCILYFVLNHYLEMDVYQKDIEKLLNVRGASISNLLSKMEAEQLIVRERVAFDDRLRRIRPTPLAIEMKEKIELDVRRLEEKLTLDISSEELEFFLRVAEKMMKNLEKRDL